MHEIRNALRAMKAAPVVSAVAILSLALGIGANTAMFSILDSLLLRSLPVKDPQRLVMVGQLPNGRTSWTNPIWEALRDRPELFEGAIAWSSTRFNLAQGGPTEFVDGVWASGRYFEVLGVPAILGRTWTTNDDRRGGGPDGAVAVISYAFWQRRFGGASDVIGRPLVIERVPFTIVGVTPPGFFGVDVGRTFDVAIPLGTEPLIRGKESSLDRRSNWWLNVMGRLRADQSLESAQTALRGVQPQVREATMPQDWREDDKQNYLKEPLTLDAGGDRQLRTARSLSTAAHHADGRRRPRAAHRVRQHRQPAARARDGAAPRAERTPGARRLARPAGATTSEREPRALGIRRRARPPLRPLVQQPARAATVDRHEQRPPGDGPRLARSRVHRRHRHRHGRDLRDRPRSARHTSRSA